ncbi:RNase P and RNase MRP subunit [Schizosaccharomyces cryophilus OY26]|uniref:RNase P and RNase MRP subunit n=1 Tax=Schizosaccharomyces cryophilus (strain OY26 / ATCC MYA-4695 / CBS 11777 / NBRC 106824 / NRRL Y48691) TaxID=653667 RepID=S9W054_SCHCR|nr:RNase P and RNase MRP subunit [Schizosaccharomyces cryophilus OY26]EPY51410.1 RNase P and RNase MRP subunit [Schizosaccharomyces cryophilus OY26]
MKRSGQKIQSKDTNVKRSKFADARHIQVESPALKNGAVDIKRFVESRSFEISALQDAMQRSKHSSAQRAFQALPRCLRRRAASHNIRRIPKALRDRAYYEMQLSSSATTPIIPSKQRLKRFIKRLHRKLARQGLRSQITNSGQLQTEHSTEDSRIPSLAAVKLVSGKFAGRQLRKVWLPTHLWTSKRAHMINAWGYAIPESPTEKSYRPTHRAAFCLNAIAFDMSYQPLVSISGPLKVLLETFGECFTTGLPAAYTRSYRSFTSYVRNSQTKELLCPCLLQWHNPNEACKTKIPVRNSENVVQLVIRLHASAFLDAWNHLSSIAVLDDQIAMHDWRLELASFDVLGPDANLVLHDIFPDIQSSEKGTWKSISTLPTTSLPFGASIGFDASLVNNESKLRQEEKRMNESGKEIRNDEVLDSKIGLWDKHEIPSFDIFNYVQQKRHLTLNVQNELVPIYITHRPKWNGLTVILPWGAAKFFWQKLMYRKGVRFGGLKNLHQIAFEKKMPFFPADFPDTKSGQAYEIQRKQRNEEHWRRRPPAKRVNYENFGKNFSEIGDPFCCYWEYFSDDAHSDVMDRTAQTFSRVEIRMVQRGALHDRARIYSIDQDQIDGWKKLIYDKKITAEAAEYPPCPKADALSGFVTTANFNLTAGRPSGIASIKSVTLGGKPQGYCLVRNVGCSIPRLAQWKLLL